jgi:hypothetical protein
MNKDIAILVFDKKNENNTDEMEKTVQMLSIN